MKRSDLERMRAWSDDKISTGAEPPWSWFQMMKLRETLDAIIAGMPVDEIQSLPSHEVRRLRIVGDNRDETTSSAPDNVVPVQMPM